MESIPAPTPALRLRTPQDVLALVPTLLGFEPQESVTLLSPGTARLHARVDLPRTEREIPAVVRALVRPCTRHRVASVLLVLHAREAEPAGQCARVLTQALVAAGVVVLEVLRADGRHWFRPLVESAGPGVAYDLSEHPFRAAAVLRGQVVFGSRDELAASLDPDPVQVADVAALLGEWCDGDPGAAPPEAVTPVASEAWVVDLLGRCREGHRAPEPAETARLLLALADLGARDRALGLLDRSSASFWVWFWTAVLAGTPEHLVPRPAVQLALASWLCGQGALARCALDRVGPPEDPGRFDRAPVEVAGLAQLIERVLDEAVPPSLWEEVAAASRAAPGA